MKRFGLIGFPLTHSFSKKYFSEKFEKENIKDCQYDLFELEDIQLFPQLINNTSGLVGLNVTIPHKKNVMPFLTDLDVSASNVGAVNVIKIVGNKRRGFNSDYYGFLESLKKFTGDSFPRLKALVLGTGGAAMAVRAALRDSQIPFLSVSRNKGNDCISYEELHNSALISSYNLIVNTTPLGMYPNIESCPPIAYDELSSQHYLFDLVYNPLETEFLKRGKANGAQTQDGLQMLHLQAEKAWEIWNS